MMASCGLVIAAILVGSTARGQVQYASGQDVAPVFEGWEKNPDGTFNMAFGYMNRNYQQEVDVPVGPDNMFAPGPVDQGQPAHFYARRQEFVFKVKVPRDWGEKELIWTLKAAGKTEKAYGSLLPTWEIGNLVYQENRRGGVGLSYPEEPNQAPTIEMVGSARRTVAVGEPLTLSIEITDDGHPKPPSQTARVRRPAGDNLPDSPKLQTPITQAIVKLEPGVRLGVTWILYRGGPGTVTFNPMRIAVAKTEHSDMPAAAVPLAGKATTTATFSQPGTYILRAYADDTVLTTPLDVIVTVQDAAKD